MTPYQLKLLRNIAKRYRKAENLPAGFVILVGGFFGRCKPEPDGWVLRLDRPSGFIPGCFAVSSTGEVFVTEGGNDYDGAKSWIPLSPLPGQDDQGACLAAPAPVNQVEGTPTLEQFQRWLETTAHKALFDSDHPPADLHPSYHAIHWEEQLTIVGDCRIATKLLMQFKHGSMNS